MLDSLDFSVACAGTTLTHGFFVSFEGHHDQDPNYTPGQNVYSGMTKTIGFPVMSSVMVAVKARYIGEQRDDRDLEEIAKEQFQSVQLRYLENAGRSAASRGDEPPVFLLKTLQKLLDDGTLTPRERAFDCRLYRLNREWFADSKMDTPLIPTGEEGTK